MNPVPILLAVCLLPIFCHGPHRHVAKVQPPKSDCEEMVKSYREGFSFATRDVFVSQYPVAKQRHVLQCLDGGK